MNPKGLYIQLFSIHGLIRGESQELGRDADTGGQIKYVLELARALGKHPDVDQVDLVTRLIDDKTVSSDYAQPEEKLSENVRLLRIQCGGRKYIRKELLWPHLAEFTDKTLKLLKKQQRIPDIFHGHYADGGYVAMELASAFDAPFVFTGHSLGRNKQEKLEGSGLNLAEINKRYKMDIRVQAEENIIKKSHQIITSTSQEIKKQYGLYDNFKDGRYKVIPPGIDLDIFHPYYHSHLDPEGHDEVTKQTRVTLLKELHRFWRDPDKPFILVLCRPDQRKNISGLLKAYGENQDLRAMANLAVFAGLRKNIMEMESNERAVLTDMLLKMDFHDLYGKLAIPKKHDFATEVPELYRLCADSGGVFVNPALVEPFGLTLIEASACGLPIIATNDGGPVDIVANCQNGALVNVGNPDEVADAIKELLADKNKWDACSRNGINGVREHYSWESHCEKTVDRYKKLLPGSSKKGKKPNGKLPMQTSFGVRLTNLSKLLITDIDNTLVGNKKRLADLLELLEKNSSAIGWGVATGRSLAMTLDIMTEQNIPIPDILICSVGTEIYYGPDLRTDKGWQQHLSHLWKPEKIREVLGKLDFISQQDAEGQRRYKISYYMEDDPEQLAAVHYHLQEAKLRCQVIYSHGQFLDILPYRASKGRAIKYLKYKWDIAPENVMVAGDSGNDEDMLRGRTCGLVVGNHSKELEHLKGQNRIFFSEKKYSGGIIDGLIHYKFL
ncbi:MAG: HAD-IIB family hydrolase [Desulfobulbaceae bacterium]|uniref:sucrose-phosphate synthase n=1 Tax=Candidatus Desulfobia pelagia TaxID=2841692 RepID=A0A8J6TCY3_9BACT|nr:HAD-IIB family hydrolase [Candidatus Desulfobia pelagia]